MPLTPEDVRNKQFTTVRLREGYDEDEVDAFLDEVEAELTRLLRENDELRAKLAAATRAAAAGGPNVPARKERERPEPPQPMPAPTPVPMPGPPQLAGPPQMGGPMGGPMTQQMPQLHASGGDSAARVLALAQQTADQAISEARNEANKIVGEARTRAEGMERDARGKADALERDAQEKHRVAMGSLESARAQLERKVEDLRAFEREYRSRLKSYLEGQLRQLESQSDDSLAPPRGGAAPQLPSSMSPAMPPPLPPSMPQSMPPSSIPQALSQPMSPQMSPAMTQPMPPVRPNAPSPQSIQQAPTPMRGFLIDEDPDN